MQIQKLHFYFPTAYHYFICNLCRCLDVELRIPFTSVPGKLFCGTLRQQDMDIIFNPERHPDKKNCMNDDYVWEFISEKCNFSHKMIHNLYHYRTTCYYFVPHLVAVESSFVLLLTAVCQLAMKGETRRLLFLSYTDL